MYKCKHCDNVFDEPILYQMSSIKIENGSDDWIEDEYVYVCPDCYSINIFEISEQEKTRRPLCKLNITKKAER